MVKLDKNESEKKEINSLYSQMRNLNNSIKENFNKEDLLSSNIKKFTSLIQLFVFGIKKSSIFFDFFIENQIINYYEKFFHFNLFNENKKDNTLKLLKSFSFFILNINEIEISNYIITHKIVNKFLKFNYDFRDEDIVFYYINFAKSIAQKFDQYPLDIFYNVVT